MGGDHAPQALVEGVNQAIQEFKDIEVILYGDEAKIKQYLTATERVTIVYTDEKINSDDEPTRAIRRKKQASMVLAAHAVKNGGSGCDAFCRKYRSSSCLWLLHRRSDQGHRSSRFDVDSSYLDGKGYDMLDLGANAENTPTHLHQYAIWEPIMQRMSVALSGLVSVS